MTTERPATSPSTHVLGMMSTTIDGLDFIASRVFDAPRALVFDAFSDCAHLAHWWGPSGWTLPLCEMDFRVGGTWRYCMAGPDGATSCGAALYREISEPERIVYTDVFTEADGTQTPDTPEMLITVTFEEAGGRTTLRSVARFATDRDLDFAVGTGMEQGLTETWDRLAAYLASR